MKDENGRETPEYDIDKLIEEYSNITANPVSKTENPPEPEKKKFVVHIDESLINVEDEENKTKTSAGGIYFSNYQNKHVPVEPPVRTQRYSETAPVKTEAEKKSAKATNEKKTGKRKTDKNPRKKTKSIGGRAAACFLAFIIASTAGLSYYGISCINDTLAISRKEDVVTVKIPEKASYDEIINILNDSGLIKRKAFCKFFAKYRGYDDNSYLSGVYYLNGKMGVEGMLTEMMAAPITADTITLSFPEGWTAQQIFEKLEKYDVTTTNKLYTAMRNADFSYDFMDAIKPSNDRYLKLEGYLFPDTYDFYVDADTNYVINKFLENFNSKWTEEYDARAQKLGYTMDEIITIASIVQKEAANASQMKTIASIIYNRLDNPSNYPTLGCDSTAIYISNYVTPIIGEAQGNSLYAKYDTGAIKGLPPGPICNPGIDAIKAALYPEDTNYYFFAHDNKGRIYLAENYKEHKNNLVQIIKANNGD